MLRVGRFSPPRANGLAGPFGRTQAAGSVDLNMAPGTFRRHSTQIGHKLRANRLRSRCR